IRENDDAASVEPVRAAFQAFRALVGSRFADLGPVTFPGDVRRLDPDEGARLVARVEKINRPGALADVIAHHTLAAIAATREVLETLEVLPRLEKAVALLSAA